MAQMQPGDDVCEGQFVWGHERDLPTTPFQCQGGSVSHRIALHNCMLTCTVYFTFEIFCLTAHRMRKLEILKFDCSAVVKLRQLSLGLW